MAIFYIGAGINHFIHPDSYIAIMPSWLPQHKLLVLLSGIAEIIGGIMILFNGTRQIGAWFIVALLIAVFPANIQMAIDFYNKQHPYLWAALLRLPLQLLLIWWAYSIRKIRL